MMRLASSKTTWVVFGVPLLLLLVIGVMADRTTTSFAASEHWVSHTHEVQTVIESVRANVFLEQDSRKGYLLTQKETALTSYVAATQQLPRLLSQLQHLTIDNPIQQVRIARLDDVVERKTSILQQSIDLENAGGTDMNRQAEFSRENEDLTVQMESLLASMNQEENGLLAQRVVVSADSYRRMRIVLVVAFIAVICFLLVTFARLLIELRNRMRAEAAVRRLSARILQLQDLERRKIARELHDGVGQYFASSKMAVDNVLEGESLSTAQREALTEAAGLLERGIAEARTLSYLLHPPLLDEVGFRAAAEWYIKGFAERSQIDVKFSAPEKMPAMSKEIELVLFRVLQESLTNIHRHAASATAKVRIFCSAGRVQMEVEDSGKGISRDLLDEFQRSVGTGVGLAGMRERVSEFQGTLQIESEGRGTLLRIEMPIPLPDPENTTSAAPPDIHAAQLSSAEQSQAKGTSLMLATVPS